MSLNKVGLDALQELAVREIAERIANEAVQKHVKENIFFGHIFGAVFLAIQVIMFLFIIYKIH